MIQRNIFFVVCVCLAASVSALAAPGDGILFQLPGFNSQSARILGYPYLANPFNPSIDVFGPAGAGLVLAKPDGSKFYVLGNSGTTSLQSADATFTNFRSVNGLSAPPTTLALTPDGKLLLVGGDQFYIIDSNTDQPIGTISVSGTIVGTNICNLCNGIAVSRDGKRAFVLANSSFGSSLNAYDLTTRPPRRVGNPLNLPFGGSRSIVMSPQGLLYVTAVNRVFEIDPNTLTITTGGEIPVLATPGPLRITPDGTTGYLANFEPAIGGASLLQINLSKRTVATWPPFNPLNSAPLFDDVQIAGNGRIFAFTSQFTTLFEIVPTPFGAAESTLSSILPINKINSVAVSNELPSARFLYALSTNQTQTTLYRVDLSTNSINLQNLATLNSGTLAFVGVPPQSGATTFLQYNNLQTLAPGSTSLPLIARVLDGTGRPIYNLTVTFTVDPASGVIVNSPSGVTNGDGFVQTTITMPATPGVYTVTLTAGTASVPFTVTIPNPGGGGGGGGGGGINQVTVFSGDGQLVEGFSVFAQPLTILVTDTTGKPLQGIPVTFTLTAGDLNINNGQTSTDDSGLASTFFTALPPTQGRAFQANTVNASTGLGSVDFTITSLLSVDSFGNATRPVFDLIQPSADNGLRITLGEGDTLQDAVVVRIINNTIPQVGVPIPGVGVTIRSKIINADGTSPPSPVSCVGSSLSDQTGTARCTALASCQIGVQGVLFVFGNYQNREGTVEITKGSASLVSVLAGNNQTGRAGDTLPITLTALVSDKCSALIGGIPVTWSVVSGSATLVNVVSVSDAAGRVSARVVLGQTPGPIQVRVAIGTVTQAVFTLTNQVVVTSLTVNSGNNQSGVTGQNFAQPVTFIVRDVNNNPVSGIVVNFAVVSGSAGINPPSATTNAQGSVSTTVSAGNIHRHGQSHLAGAWTHGVVFRLRQRRQLPARTGSLRPGDRSWIRYRGRRSGHHLRTEPVRRLLAKPQRLEHHRQRIHRTYLLDLQHQRQGTGYLPGALRDGPGERHGSGHVQRWIDLCS